MGPTFHPGERALWLILYRLVERMSPRQRTAWLVRCCKLASHGADPVTVSDCRGEVDEVWWCYRAVANQGRLTEDRAGKVASNILRGR